jgi:hypothetical protein
MSFHINKKWILLFLLLVIITLIVIFIFRGDSQLSTKDQFNSISNDSSSIGGLLVHMMEIKNLTDMMTNDSFSLSNMDDCAPINRKTCSAWTLVRRDLSPMVFISPSKDCPSVGVMINANKAWDLITTMSHIDSNTTSRNCCQQESGQPVITRWPYQTDEDNPCINKLLEVKGFDLSSDKYKGYVVYIPTVNNDGGMCSSICAHNDLFCKYVNAGGSINIFYMWTELKECLGGQFDKCYNFHEQDASEIPDDLKKMIKDTGTVATGYIVQETSSDCNICTKPYLCVTQTPPSGVSNNTPVVSNSQISTYVNPDGLGWNDIYTKNNDFDPYDIAATQCKWEKKDLKIWLNSVKKYYSDISKQLSPDNSTTDAMNYLLANPSYVIYLENEFNIYVNPDQSSPEYNDQNKIFMDAIEGFFYIPSTCEDSLKVLNNIKTSKFGKEFSTGVDRCDAFFDPMKGDQRRQYEKNKVDQSKSTVIQFTKWFNSKYGKNVDVYSANFSSNAYPDVKNIKDASNNNIMFDSIFTKL